jgi:hypothetical protein
LIAENLYSQVDSECKAYSVFKDIVGHRVDPKLAVKRDDPLYLNGQRKNTTVGWDIEVEMEDGSSLFLPLKDVKSPTRLSLLSTQSQLRSTKNQRFNGGYDKHCASEIE